MASNTLPPIVLLGTGLMGAPMARNILKAGYPLTVWNRSRAKAEDLVAAGAKLALTTAEAAAAGAIIIADMSSIKPAEAQRHAALLADRGIGHVDAPVSGGTVGAESGSLAIMAGGDSVVYARIEPVLRSMGRPTHVGPHGAGQLAKLANQIIVGVTIGAVAEALLLAKKGGADPGKVREALRGGFAESRILDLHGQRMVERDFVTKGRSVTHLKDLDNALDAADRLGVEATPFTAATADLFRGLLANAGDLDHSALLVELERRNGIQN